MSSIDIAVEKAPEGLIDATIYKRRRALFSLFFIIGLCMATWVSRTPDIRDSLSATTAEMGMVLFGLSLGSIIGVLSAAVLVRHFGTKPIVSFGVSSVVLSLSIMAVGASLSIALVVAAGLFAFGLGMATAEIALNIEGANVEQIIRRSVLTQLHGFFSFGTFLGAVCGIALTAMKFPVALHLLCAVGVGMVITATALGHIRPGLGRRPVAGQGNSTAESPSLALHLKDVRLLLICILVLAIALAEGAASDWLPLLMVDGHGYSGAASSIVYAGFTAVMTIGRFAGSYFIERFGRDRVLRACLGLGVAGLAGVIFINHPILAGLAALLWGLGVSIGFPIGISAAGDTPNDPEARVSIASTAAYFAFLVGPPMLGFLGEHFGLRMAMTPVLAMLTIVFFLVPAVRSRSRT